MAGTGEKAIRRRTLPPQTINSLTIGVSMLNFLKDLYFDEKGQDIVEYSLLLVLIGAAALFVLTTMGQSITEIFSKINTKLESANHAIS